MPVVWISGWLWGIIIGGGSRSCRIRTHETEEHRKYRQPLEESEGDDQKEDLEERTATRITMSLPETKQEVASLGSGSFCEFTA